MSDDNEKRPSLSARYGRDRDEVGDWLSGPGGIGVAAVVVIIVLGMIFMLIFG